MRRRLVEQQEVGSCASSAASATRRRSPPESVRTSRASMLREADRRERGARELDVLAGFPPPAREVRMPSDERGLEHGGRETRRPCPAAASPAHRARARRPGADVPAGEQDRARRGPAQSGERGEQRRLAGAVGPITTQHSPRMDVERQAGAQRAAGDREREARGSASERLVAHGTDLRRSHRNSGTPTSAVITPTGSCARRDDRARERVGEHEQRAAGERRGRQQTALIVADDEPHRMRNDEADEADAAGDGHGHRRGERRERVQRQRDGAHANAERGGRRRRRARERCVAREQERCGEREAEHGERALAVRRHRQVADQPEQHAVDLRVGRERQHQRDQRAPAGGDDDAGQQQAGRRPRAAPAREPEHEERRDRGAGERRGRGERGEAEEHRAERAARRAAGQCRARTGRRADCAASPASARPRSRAGRRRRTRRARAAAAGRARSDAAVVVSSPSERAPHGGERDVHAADGEREARAPRPRRTRARAGPATEEGGASERSRRRSGL